MRIIVIPLTFFLFINIVGCRSLHYEDISLKPDEYVKYEKNEGKPKEISIFTKDSLKYHFAGWMYDIKNDTMYAEGPQIVDGNEVPFKGDIPLQNINTIEWTEQKQSGIYIAMGVTIVMVLGLLVYAIISF